MHLASLCALLTVAAAPADRDLLFWFTFNEGQGSRAADAAGGGLEAAVGAGWAASPAGTALELDGTAATIARVQVPEAQRFGTGSWSLGLWLKPRQFTIDDAQNQRRIFAFGSYPDAYLVVDLMAAGHLNYYFCYRREDGSIASTGGGSAAPLTLDQWAHVALTVDRDAGKVVSYVNGFAQGSGGLPADWAGDFKLGGELTLGNGWHNYWGLMDEVKVWRRALTRAEVKAEFARLKEVFGVSESPEAAAAERRELLLESFERANRAWAGGDLATARAIFASIRDAAESPPHLRGTAHLRLAQSLVAVGEQAAARDEYRAIAANAQYPEVPRLEAGELAEELDRTLRGLPARDPAATRVGIRPLEEFAAEVFVAPDGDDAAEGTEDDPVAGLARARDLVSAYRQAGVTGAIRVVVRPGEYRVNETLVLGEHDSGTADGPTVYAAERPGTAVFYGGQRLTGFAPVTDRAILARLPEEARGQVLACDLNAQGVTDLGQLAVRGFGQAPSPPTLELFVDGVPMTLARWPNDGFQGIERLVEPGNRDQGTPSIIEYQGDRPERWLNAEEPWLFGYFRYLWADATIQVGAIDPAARTITCPVAYQYGGPGMDTGQGIQWYAFNLLEEIDQPGEWYLNRQTGILYLQPPKPLADATVEIGLLTTPMITLDGVANVRFEGLTLDLGRSHGVIATNCRELLFAGCTVSRLAGNGISIYGGEGCGLLGCDVHTIGRRATEVIGGDRETLTPGRHFVENCRIHDFGRIDRTYTPAIQLEGCGLRVAHNLMYNGPSSVMRIEGNDHLIEYNDVHSAVRESDDQGGMELFANPSYRGVVFRHNRYLNVGKDKPGAAVHGQAAIRFDDAISGMLVYGNLFVDSANGNFGAVQMNSGRDNLMEGNVFVDCKQGLSGGWHPGNSVWNALRAGQASPAIFLTDLYLQRYPLMATMLDEPAFNFARRNVFYRCGQVIRGNEARLELLSNGVYGDGEDPGFVDAAAGDYRFRPDARALAEVGLRPIPLAEIGLYEDVYRASWPVVTTPVTKPDWRAGGH